MKKTLILIWNGTAQTLSDDIALCMNEVLTSLKLDTYKIDEYKYFVEIGMDVLMNENTLKNSIGVKR